MGKMLLSVLIMYIVVYLIQQLYRKLTPVVVDMRDLKDTETTYSEWNTTVFNPSIRRAHRTNRELHVIRYDDDVNRGKPNDKFVIDEPTRLSARPLPVMQFK